MERRRVVITGLGAVTPIGLTAADSWQAVKDGVCGVAPITQFDSSELKVHLAAEVKGFDPENYMGKPEAKRMGRFTQLALVSAQEAMASAGFTLDEAEADRCGVIVSSGIGGLSITEAEHDRGLSRGYRPGILKKAPNLHEKILYVYLYRVCNNYPKKRPRSARNVQSIRRISFVRSPRSYISNSLWQKYGISSKRSDPGS